MLLWSNKKTIKLDYDFRLLNVMAFYKWSYTDIQNMPEDLLMLAIWKLNLDNKNKK